MGSSTDSSQLDQDDETETPRTSRTEDIERGSAQLTQGGSLVDAGSHGADAERTA